MIFHDFFAGIGGSSQGLLKAGLEGAVALNHWEFALNLHNENHPHMDHDKADIWKADPRRYKPAEVGWFSPECRGHSIAAGKTRYAEHYVCDLWRNPTTDPADDRSRMLMESVPHISSITGYKYVLVENVVEVVKWLHFNRWLKEMEKLGYSRKLLFLNSQFFGTPQSRDRFFAVFWKKGMPAPDLDFRPEALCAKCGWVRGVQAWKPGRWYGKYDRQYIYACPNCNQRVEPEINGAYTVINWEEPITRIGDRPKGLSQKTIAKIKYGMERFGNFVVDTTHSDNVSKSRPLDQPLQTQTTQQSFALTISYYGRVNAANTVDAPLPTVPTENKIGLAYIETLRKSTHPTRIDEAMPTIVAGGNQHALVMTYNGNPVFAPTDQPMPTVRTVQSNSLIVPEVDINDVLFRMLKPRELASGTGFPQGYILKGSQRNQTRGIGGAVDPNVAAWLGKQVLEAVR